MYGYDSKAPFDEISEFKPNTPYAKAKLEIHNETLKFIEKYDWKIISGLCLIMNLNLELQIF